MTTNDVRWGRPPRVLVLAIDGLDFFLARAWLGEGTLPALARIAGQGVFSRLETVNPAASPVAWSSFLTGCNPGKHGIFDFVAVDPRTLVPGPTTVRRKPGPGPREWACLRELPGIGELLTAAGVSVAQVLAPVSFPAPADAGFVICGMETPDRCGTQGTYRVLSADREIAGGDHRHGLLLDAAGGEFTAQIPLADARPLNLRMRTSGTAVIIENQDGPVSVRPGEWTGWLTFGSGADATVAQFHCRSADPPTLYMSPPQYAPDHPHVCTDQDRARAIVARAGTYPTLGYPYDTQALEDGVLSDEQFLTHVEDTAAQLHTVARAAAETNDADVFIAYFTEIDAIQHMFWRGLDYGHARYADSADLRTVIQTAYRNVDRAVAEFTAGLDQDTTILVVSDHGCNGYRFSFDLNRWLHDNGYLEWDRDAAPVNAMYWGVDWSRTRAYSHGMGRISVNLAGRERYGVVAPGEQADSLLAEIADRLLGLRVELGAGRVVSQVWRSGELYQGQYAADAPDLTIGLQPGLRSDTSSALGGIAEAALSPNERKWSGDHASVDPVLVPGVLVSNRVLKDDCRRLVDLAPTVLDLSTVQVPDHMDGSTLLRPAR